MAGLSSDDEQAADRLAFQLLHDAFCELAGVLKRANTAASDKMLDVIEDRMVAALSRLYADRAEGVNSDEVITAAGERLSAVLDEARGLSAPRNATSSSTKT
ncbi:hypothetical protein [Methylobacterium gnaphalii]|uniref:Uncharacterized protein n=2 Tax=Methylobacterium gnaphalii TaxID=1010610 RepID=A0A512JJP2_9HYPH|nr:hypothetical protein [Methylobacterium gnaphalii]GEP10169.1 hypothetical protein MGN01_20140 [Methylobacterium gnaphalii]GJD69522.1 hypothetical protein MMMDOFMJ_2453 [Methylobacterium gnaphalii]GLS48685.1 hypothetical protein GCM10007885_15290 [Methylobacterium gnaphalii]